MRSCAIYQMIRRNPLSGDRSEVDTPFFNLGLVETQGVGIHVYWIKDIVPGAASMNLIISWEGSASDRRGMCGNLLISRAITKI